MRPRDADKVEWFTADHETAGSDDLCFHRKLPTVVAHLKAHGVAIEEGPVALLRPRHAALGLLPGSGREPDRDFVV